VKTKANVDQDKHAQEHCDAVGAQGGEPEGRDAKFSGHALNTL
jgi:hypothetical protein